MIKLTEETKPVNCPWKLFDAKHYDIESCQDRGCMMFDKKEGCCSFKRLTK